MATSINLVTPPVKPVEVDLTATTTLASSTTPPPSPADSSATLGSQDTWSSGGSSAIPDWLDTCSHYNPTDTWMVWNRSPVHDYWKADGYRYNRYLRRVGRTEAHTQFGY